ncbi:glycosyltransferase involved in cell wall biosynthesis [Rhizobium sp. PP-F2F-G48]|uniref:glycosyltransferase family 4 protein n=1 Tax=Rhizobium sp. PP-F2F-G48 TaxID=2135651 RepID=UPI0010E68263|nr:glycosyltransferase family 4 protein [Rhizobium sp. PP-F2F-G48]TCM57770.1 glycosyltransferase involved in cell wall biosynthesis [Rhizobium sp. PP-F2F-G48]
MRIAICNALYPTPDDPLIFGGAEVFVRQFAEELVQRGDTVTVLRASLKGRRSTENVNGVTVEFIPVRNLFPPFEERKNPLVRLAWHAIDDRIHASGEIQRILDAFAPDLLHSHTLNGLSTDVWRMAKRLKLPILHTMHDYYLICPKCSRFKSGASCQTTCGSCRVLSDNRRRRTALVDAVASVSQRTLDIHRENGVFDGSKPTYVVRNVPNPAIVFSELTRGPGPLTIGYLGRFSEEKGVRLLLEAVARLRPGSVRLLLAGRVSDAEKETLKALAPEADVDFVGFVSPSDFYRQVQVVVMPSIWHEPGSLALVDALAAGRPVIGTPFGGIPEIIEDGVTGWIAEATPQGMSAAISRLVAEPQLVVAAHEALAEKRHARRAFSDVVDDYQSIYSSLLRGRSNSPGTAAVLPLR